MALPQNLAKSERNSSQLKIGAHQLREKLKYTES